MERLDVEQYAKVRYGHIVSVDGIARGNTGSFVDMGHELVAVEVPINPRLGAAALWAPKDVAVEMRCCIEVIDRNREMKPMECAHEITVSVRGAPR